MTRWWRRAGKTVDDILAGRPTGRDLKRIEHINAELARNPKHPHARQLRAERANLQQGKGSHG